jgi:hypothetical protein
MISLGLGRLGAPTMIGKLRLWLKGRIVSDAPPELSVCEFDCRKTNCSLHDWEHCQNRLTYQALAARSDGATSESRDRLRDLTKAYQRRDNIKRETAERFGID